MLTLFLLKSGDIGIKFKFILNIIYLNNLEMNELLIVPYILSKNFHTSE